MPRRLTPCELGSATRLEDLRKTANEGSRRSASSRDLARPISVPGMTVTGAVASPDASAARAGVITMVSLISSPPAGKASASIAPARHFTARQQCPMAISLP